MRNFSGTIHSWGELGLTYGRILMDGNRHFLKGGVTLKYLQGAGSTFASSSNLSGQYSANSGTLTTTGSLQYASTQGFNSNDIDFEEPTGGFGADIGFIYEYRREPDRRLLGESARSTPAQLNSFRARIPSGMPSGDLTRCDPARDTCAVN